MVKKIIYITNAEWQTLVGGGSITIGGQTISYSDDYDFRVKDELPALPTTNGDYKLHIADGVATWVSI